MINEESVLKMEDGKEKELMKILKDGGKPFIKKHDGVAVKVDEDKEITYKDYNDQELTLKVPSGSYVVTEGDSCYPKIITAEEFEKSFKFLEEKEPKKEKKEEEGIKIGITELVK